MPCICLADITHENKPKKHLKKMHLEITPLPLKYQFMWEVTLQLISKAQPQCTVEKSTEECIF